MTIKPLHLTEQALANHDAAFESLQRTVVAMLRHAGLSVSASAADSDNEADLGGKLLDKGAALPPIGKAVLRAFTGVLRSLVAVHSVREEAVNRLVDVLRSVGKGVDVVADYRTRRAQEIESEVFLDGAVGRQSIHTPERSRHVDALLEQWLAQAAAMIETTQELGELLADERPDAVKAGIYSAKGAGGKAEFALLLVDQGVHQDQVGMIRGNVRGTTGPISLTALKSRAQAAGELIRVEVDRARKKIHGITLS